MFHVKFGVNDRSKCYIYKFAGSELASLQVIQSDSYPVNKLSANCPVTMIQPVVENALFLFWH